MCAHLGEQLGHATLRQPADVVYHQVIGGGTGADETHGAGQVFADVGEQPEGVTRLHPEVAGPALEDPLVVGKKPTGQASTTL